MVLYVSCYTDIYKEEAEGLIKTLEQFSLPHKVEELPSLGSWDLNTKLKTTYIKRMMVENPGTPVVWLDADARVKQDPILFSTITQDFAAHTRRKVELLSGTLYFANNEVSHELVDKWIERNKQRPKMFDQKNLHDIVKQYLAQNKMSIFNLPATYCLFDLIVKHEKVNEDPVIWHRQASRRLKRLANKRKTR